MATVPANAPASAAATNHPAITYEAELAAMNRRRVALYERLRGLGHQPQDALAAVNAADEPTPDDTIIGRVLPDGSYADVRKLHVREPMFTDAELRALRASDRVVDQQEPGGILDRLDRAARKTGGAA